MEDFRLVTMRQAARTVEYWIKFFGPRDAEDIVRRHIITMYDEPEWRDAYATAFGK